VVELRRVRRQQIVRQAEGYLELGMAQHALEVLARLGTQTSLTGEALYLRGEALRELHRYGEAVVPLKLAAKENPENIRAWLALGWCYKRVGRLYDAIKSLESAQLIDPEDPLINYNLACYFSLARRKDLALDYLSRALELDFNYRELIDQEQDFDSLRNDRDFQNIIASPV